MPWSRQYSATKCASNVARNLSTGDSFAGDAITIDLVSPSGPNVSVTNSLTSRPRSPIKPITTTSASVYLVIMPKRTLFPTPEPAISPMRWPRPSVKRPLMVFTPTSSGDSIVPLSIGFIMRPWSPSSLSAVGAGLPSSG